MATTRKTSSSKPKAKSRSTAKTAAGPTATPKTGRSAVTAKPKTKAVAAKPVQGVTLETEAAAPEAAAATGPAALTKRELLARVRKSTGVKGRDVRAVTEAVLAELGDALGRGDALKLQPLGTMRVQRQKSSGAADLLVLKLRRKKPGPGGKDPLAEAAE